jgi:hypothetical protein
MIIRKPQSKITTLPKLFIGENEIECVASFKYFRVHIDEFLASEILLIMCLVKLVVTVV